MKTIARLLVIGTALVLSPAALAGGYHCMLKVKGFKIHAGNKYELKVVKVGPDRAKASSPYGILTLRSAESGPKTSQLTQTEPQTKTTKSVPVLARRP